MGTASLTLGGGDLFQEERLAKRLVDREVIVQQMKEAERQKMLVEEAREQENQAMIALVKRYQEEDRVAAEKRMKEVTRSRAEVVAANEDAIRRKERAKAMQREEEEAILMYQVGSLLRRSVPSV